MNLLARYKGSKEAKNAGWLIAGKLAQMLLSFVVSILTARYLGTANFGIINYANAYVAFFTALCTLGINSVIVKEFVDEPDRQGETLGSAIGLRLISSMLSVVMIVLIVNIVDRNDKTVLAVAFLCSLSLVFHAFDTFNYWFQSRYASKVTAFVTLIAYLVITVYRSLLLIFEKNVMWFAASAAVDYACVALLLYISYRRAGGPRLSFRFARAGRLLGKSYHYILSGMMVAVYGQTDKIMLKHMMDEATVGEYALATTICSLWTFVLTAVIDSVYPTIVKLYSEKRKEEFEKKNRQLYAVVIYLSAFVGIMFLFFGEWAIGLLYGQEYIGAAAPLRVVCWYTIFSYLGVARNAWILCENKQKYLKYMYLAAAGLNIVLNWFMIPVWGAVGAALASLLTQIATSMLLPCLIPAMRPNVRLMAEAFLLRGLK